MASAQQHFPEPVNGTTILQAVSPAEREEAAQRWRMRGQAILDAVARGEIDALEHYDGSELTAVLDEAAQWGLAIDEVDNWPPVAEVLPMFEEVFAKGLQLRAWTLCRMHRIEHGQVVGYWRGEAGGPEARCEFRPWVELKDNGDVTWSDGAPPYPILLRAVREAVALGTAATKK